MNKPTLTEFLTREMRISERELTSFLATAPQRYKVYTIPKRTGGRREIAHPAPELKVAQRAIVREFLRGLPVHPCATAYVEGASIRANAEMHVHNRPILKYDFQNFFPSITEYAWLAYCEQHELFNREDALLGARILFRRAKGSRVLRLSIGAPSSPILSNILLNDFDREIHERVSEHKITYTRYADDLTFSAKRTWNLREVDKILRSVISNLKYPNLIINENKTNLVTTKYRRQVTGLVLTADSRISVGRDKKRRIRSAIHYAVNGKLARREIAALSGYLSFLKDVEPEFYTRMERVYGKDAIDEIIRSSIGFRRDKTWS